jgi:hypothetical protein
MPDLWSFAPADRDFPACSRSVAKVGPAMPDLRSFASADWDTPANMDFDNIDISLLL